MIKAKIRKEKDALLLELPQELSGIPANSDAEIFPLREGFYLLSMGGMPAPPRASQSGLSLEELSVLDRISRVRFEQRTPAAISKILSPDEKKSLDSLVEKRAVSLFRKGKYSGEGVYSISDSLYPRGAKRDVQANPAGTTRQGEEAEATSPPPILGGRQYLIIEQSDQQRFQDAKTLELLKKGEILGVKGFDKRLYVATRAFYEANFQEFLNALSAGARNPDALSEELKISPDACRVMLVLLCENGEVIEKKKGLYQAV